MCGGGVVDTDEPVSDDADLLCRIVHGEAEKRDVYAHVDHYYVGREPNRQAA
ncbi:MAG TPA: hypothetical protein VGO81_18615 [Solirubrobacteraceae bacterium]|jgi:hypothetical protein|nr:hypothetical protein [Solirubrobacteraceae bacterium]